MENILNYELIGKRLRTIRKKKGYTQEKLAEKAEISSQHYCGIETGGAKVSLSTLVRLCNVLDTTPDEVLMDSVKKTTPNLLAEVAEVFSDSSPDEIYLMLAQAKSIKEAIRVKGFLSTKE